MEDVTCNTGSHSVACHPTQTNTPRLNPRQRGWYSIYLPQRDGSSMLWTDNKHSFKF